MTTSAAGATSSAPAACTYELDASNCSRVPVLVDVYNAVTGVHVVSLCRIHATENRRLHVEKAGLVWMPRLSVVAG